MSSLFRSQTMKYYTILIQREAAWEVMNQLAQIDLIHLIDPDPNLPSINKPFYNQIKRCDDLLNKVDVITQLITKFNRNIAKSNDVNDYLQYISNILSNRQQPGNTYLDEIETFLDQSYSFQYDQSLKLESLQERLNLLVQEKAVVTKSYQLLGDSFFSSKQLNLSLAFDSNFSYLIGSISKTDHSSFEKMVFRITKGNLWLRIEDIDESLNHGLEQIKDPKKLTQLLKCVFIIIFPGSQESTIVKRKLIKVTEAFDAQLFEFSPQVTQEQKMNQIQQDINELNSLISMTISQISNSQDVMIQPQANAQFSYIEQLRVYLLREKYLYQNLNYLKTEREGSYFLSGSFWIPESKVDQMNTLFNSSQQCKIHQLHSDLTPPTYFPQNDLTSVFQQIIDTYGTPRYQEINPALFTIITFPFLFSVMFADIGHGFVLLLFGTTLTLFPNFMPDFKSARYLFLLMGLFAFYNGLIYNDYLSISLNLFGSCYSLKDEQWSKLADCTYPFGIDPVWQVSNNGIEFVNSYKMKLAVIIGVIHMTLGIVMKGVNAIFFRNLLDFTFEFIPQLIFMLATFGYMDFLIIYKWLHQYPNPASIIATLINMILSPSSTPDPALLDAETQKLTQMILLFLALAAVPLMLLPKPLILVYCSKNKNRKVMDLNQEVSLVQLNEDTQSKSELNPQEAHSKEDESSEIFVHQIIETIEFVLGSISNTASYLRLWALSLAHSQLAEVFYDMTLASFIMQGNTTGTIGATLAYPVFALVTFGVLMVMDSMECFLHALRLHWVEFQNKFYKADGYSFVPYSFRRLLDA